LQCEISVRPKSARGQKQRPLREAACQLRLAADTWLQYRRQIAPCKHGATNLRLFGSAIRGDERPDSDIDLLVDLAENRGFRDYLALVEEPESLLGRRVEVIIARSLCPHFRPYVEGEARPL
jgi:predicted nucleotidyltransferase